MALRFSATLSATSVSLNPDDVYGFRQTHNFSFAGETRFPIHEVERDADGKVVLRDGLQVWKPRDLRLGITTAFSASNAVRPAAEFWAGRDIPWGQNGVLKIESQSFIEFNAFYSPSAKMIFFGIGGYRLPGETQTRICEAATSWEMAAHESGHAVHHTIKANGWGHNFDTWGESFADQTEMWTSLRDPQRLVVLDRVAVERIVLFYMRVLNDLRGGVEHLAF